MKGDLRTQLSVLFRETGIYQKGVSKRLEKAQAKDRIVDRGGKVNSHEIAKETSIYGKGTFKNFRSTCNQLVEYINSSSNRDRNIESIGNKTIEKFLEYTIEKGVTYGTYQNTVADLTKLEGVLTRFAEKTESGNTYNFDKPKAYLNDRANQLLEKGVEARAYHRPQEMIDQLKDERFNLVATIQLESGSRINEASLIDKTRMGGLAEIRGQEMGVIHLRGPDCKGGLERDVYVPKETYERIKKFVAENGKLHIPRGYERDVYREALKEAAEATDQKYTGSHGLRHNFAQDRMAQELRDGVGRSIALTKIAVEMGHFREDITEHYLRAA